MVQAAAAAAKIVTAAPAGLEAGSAVVNVVTAAPKVLETAQAAVAATEVTGVVKAAEVGTGVAPEALQAATKIDRAVATGVAAPEQAMRDLVASPVLDVKDAAEQVAEVKGVVSSEASTIAAEWADQKHTEIFRAVQPQMVEWDKSNPPGNDIAGWIEQRAAAEKQLTVKEAVNRDLEEWKFHHPEPDKVNDKVAHENWEKQLAVIQGQSRQSNETSYDEFLRAQEEKNQGMSREEFMRKYAKLLQLRAIADKNAMNIQKLRGSLHKTPEYKVALTQAEAQLESQRAQIELLEGELQFDAVQSESILKQVIIPAAVGVSMAAGAMAGPANEV